jgi:hypothetical protein
VESIPWNRFLDSLNVYKFGSGIQELVDMSGLFTERVLRLAMFPTIYCGWGHIKQNVMDAVKEKMAHQH